MVQLESVGCKFAQAWWADEHYKFRNVRIMTPLRLDICPGSCLQLDGLNVGNLAVATEGIGVNSKLFGYVLDVGITIDAEAAMAATNLTLTHVRGDQDETEGLIPERHPLYDIVWPGSPLVKLDERDIQADPEAGLGEAPTTPVETPESIAEAAFGSRPSSALTIPGSPGAP